MRLAILGNSGSGKSTLARWVAARTGAAYLDLDTVAWEPGQAAVVRDGALARADVADFCGTHEDWVVEGCYASLIAVALPSAPRLVWLNPGVGACLANCRARAWEPHKFASREAQDAQLAALLEWVGTYGTRQGDTSLSAHRTLFGAYAGPKVERLDLPDLERPCAELLQWLR
jgi:adenylate kinase family enzyme